MSGFRSFFGWLFRVSSPPIETPDVCQWADVRAAVDASRLDVLSADGGVCDVFSAEGAGRVELMCESQNDLQIIERVVGSLEPIGFRLRKNDDTPYDLTGETVDLKLVKMGDAVTLWQEAATVDDAALGEVSYNPVASGDGAFDVAGLYAMYLVVSNGVIFPHDGARMLLRLNAANQPQC